MISKTKLKIRTRRKTAPELVETIRLAYKNPAWLKIAKILSGPTRAQSAKNLSEIDSQSSIGDTILIPGKILSKGELTKKLILSALSISAQAKEKLKTTKSEFIHLIEEIKKNKKAEGVKILA